MNILCPYCLEDKEHKDNKCGYWERWGRSDLRIPQSYINLVSKGIPVYPVVVVGYTTCGKTTYLCSLINELFESKFFHIEALNQDTISTIRNRYLDTLRNQRRFLEPTLEARVLEDPLLIKLEIFQKSWFGLSRSKKLILILYDVSGGTYRDINTIIERFPLISKIPNLIILIDLYGIYTKYPNMFEAELQALITTVKNALEELGSSLEHKNAIICFTKADEIWGKENFGPLSEKDKLPIDDLNEYYINMIERAKKIEDYLSKNSSYDDFYRSVMAFGGYFFISCSSVGGRVDHKTNTFDVFNPYRVIDPLLWLIKGG